MDPESLKRLQAQRFALLQAVYDEADGRAFGGVPVEELATKLAFDETLTERIIEYLIGRGLLGWFSGGTVAITPDGMSEVEEAIAEPTKPTEHFMPLMAVENYIHVAGSMIGSAIQQGTHDSEQTVSSSLDVKALGVLAADLRSALAAVDLPERDRREAESDLATLDAQLSSPEPKRAIVRESLQSLQRIAEAAVASGAAPQLATWAEQLARAIGGIV